MDSLCCIILDTETTSFGSGVCRLLQLGYQIYRGRELLLEKELCVNPEGFPVTATEIHGLTEEYLIENGLPIKEVLEILLEDISQQRADVLVCHNLSFDFSVIFNEFKILEDVGMSIIPIASLRSYCKCKNPEVIEYCKTIFGWRKFPRLGELHQALFTEEVLIRHRALDDVRVTAQCFFKLIDLGVIKELSLIHIIKG